MKNYFRLLWANEIQAHFDILKKSIMKGKQIMKALKKISGILLAAVIVLSLTVTAFAAGTNKITVNTAAENESYSIYKMLDLSVDEGFTAYRYTVADKWNEFFTTGDGKDYVDIDAHGYVTWKDGKKSEADMTAFGKSAAAFAKAKAISATATKTPGTGNTSVVFDGLDSGYYLITSTLGTKVIVQTTPDNPDPVINEKNSEPTVDKLVKEDSTNKFGKENTAQIGDTVEFKTTVKAKSGAKKYVLHDKMCEGLTLDQNSFKITVNDALLTLTEDYTVSFTNDDGCDFEITFTESFLNGITADTDIVVLYNAVLNDDAAIYEDTNKNETWLTYGDNSSTVKSETETLTFKFELVKTKSDNTFLSGAKFELYDSETDGEKIALVKENDGTYRIATEEETATSGFESAVIEAGTIIVKGLDSDTYWLEETQAPVGYNKLDNRVEVKIEDSNLLADKDDSKWLSGGVHVVNKTGAELPSTGGMGTTVLYVVGSVLVLGAAVLLIAKKRMNNV